MFAVKLLLLPLKSLANVVWLLIDEEEVVATEPVFVILNALDELSIIVASWRVKSDVPETFVNGEVGGVKFEV